MHQVDMLHRLILYNLYSTAVNFNFNFLPFSVGQQVIKLALLFNELNLAPPQTTRVIIEYYSNTVTQFIFHYIFKLLGFHHVRSQKHMLYASLFAFPNLQKLPQLAVGHAIVQRTILWFTFIQSKLMGHLHCSKLISQLQV